MSKLRLPLHINHLFNEIYYEENWYHYDFKC